MPKLLFIATIVETKTHDYSSFKKPIFISQGYTAGDSKQIVPEDTSAHKRHSAHHPDAAFAARIAAVRSVPSIST